MTPLPLDPMRHDVLRAKMAADLRAFRRRLKRRAPALAMMRRMRVEMATTDQEHGRDR